MSENKRYILTFWHFGKDRRLEATSVYRTKPIAEKEMRKILKKRLEEFPQTIWDARTKAGKPV